MINTIGFRNGEKACHFGELYSSQEALKLNLVDKIVDQKDLQTESEKTMKEWLKIPGIFYFLILKKNTQVVFKPA